MAIEPDDAGLLRVQRGKSPRPAGAKKAVVEPRKRTTSGTVDVAIGAMAAGVPSLLRSWL